MQASDISGLFSVIEILTFNPKRIPKRLKGDAQLRKSTILKFRIYVINK